MSKLIAEITRESIVMCSDSRLAVKVGNDFFVADDNFKKLFVLDNKNILWGSGSSWILSTLAERFSQYPFKDMHVLVDLAKAVVEEFKKIDGQPCDEHGYLQFVLAQVKNGEILVHLTGDKYNWEVVSQSGTDEKIPIFGGVGCDIGRDTYRKFKTILPFKDIARKSFDLASCELIGGTLHVVTMDLNGIEEECFPINDESKNIKRLSSEAYAKDLYLGDGNSVLSALTKNDKGLDSIKGDMLDGKGLFVRDETDEVSLQVDSKGNLTTSGVIVASKIFGGKPMQAEINAAPVGTIRGVYIDGSVFNSTLDSAGNTTGRLNFNYLNLGNIVGSIYVDDKGAGSSEENKYRIFVTTEKDFALKLKSSAGMSLESNNGIYLQGSGAYYNGEEIATKSYVQQQISSALASMDSSDD